MTYSSTQNKANPRFTKDNAKRFAMIAEEIFAPIYPVIADNIYNRTAISSGMCIDIGCGAGHLGLALAARLPELQVRLLDPSQDMLSFAEAHRLASNFGDRISLQQGSAEALPFPDNSAQLIVSRGSIFFWQDQVQSLNEIYRVLAANGWACIGGGFGNEELMFQVRRQMRDVDPNWDRLRQKRISNQGAEHFNAVLEKSIINNYQVCQEKAGLWILIKK